MITFSLSEPNLSSLSSPRKVEGRAGVEATSERPSDIVLPPGHPLPSSSTSARGRCPCAQLWDAPEKSYHHDSDLSPPSTSSPSFTSSNISSHRIRISLDELSVDQDEDLSLVVGSPGEDESTDTQQQRPSSTNRPLKAWEMFRPVLDHCPKLKRRELRKLNRNFTLAEVREHRYRDDLWIAVDGKVYDITEHLVDHPGWDNAGISTVLSILAHAGTECSKEFHDIHRAYPVAYRQLKAFYIGDLA